MVSAPPATILPILGAMASVFWPARSMVVTTATVAAAVITISVSVAASNKDGTAAVIATVISTRAVWDAFLDAARKAYSRKTYNSSYKQRFYLHERSSYTRM